MPISPGLQKYFDSQQQKKGDFKKRFQQIASQVDPKYMQSFEEFHDKILGIVEENPEASDIVEEELQELDMNLLNANRKHNLKKAASLIEAIENL